MDRPVVRSLHVYPVKACRGFSVPSSDVLPAGLRHDRTFTVIRDDGVCVTQRTHPVLATVTVGVQDEGRVLTLSAPELGRLAVEVQFDGKRLPLTVFRHTGDGVDQGDAAAGWFSSVLGLSVRLARVPPDHRREASGETPGTAGFADGQAVTVASTASLDNLNDRIVARGGDPVPMSRFRPNIEVGGWSEPFAEDRVRRLVVGTADLAYAKRDTRCSVTLVDQDTGARTGSEPIRTLSTYRRDPLEGKVAFAMKCNVVRGGRIAVGDALDVQAWGPGLEPA